MWRFAIGGRAAATVVAVGLLVAGTGSEGADINRLLLPSPPGGDQAPVTYYVATNGKDDWSGRLASPNAGRTDGPLATLPRAREVVREALRRAAEPKPVEVVIRGGVYQLKESFVLGREDSGVAAAPVTWRAAEGETVRLTGGPEFPLAGLAKVSDAAVAAKLRPEVRDQVREIDLTVLGLAVPRKFRHLGFSFRQISDPEVFVQGKPLQLSRWPKTGFMAVTSVVTQGTGEKKAEGPPGAVFTAKEQRMAGWDVGRGLGAWGKWGNDWAPSRTAVVSIQGDQITLGDPPEYGIQVAGDGPGGRFYLLNILEELSAPGEYCIDRRTSKLYLVPPADAAGASVLVSAVDKTLVVLQDASHIRLMNLIIEGGREDGFRICDGFKNTISGCEIRNFGCRAGEISGAQNRLQGCHIHDLGFAGVILDGGDRRTLTPGGNVVEDCDIHDYNRLTFPFGAGIRFFGVGNVARHNHIHHSPYVALWRNGNDHLIEFNEVDHICQDSSDIGAFYTGRDPSERGVIIRYNYFHDIASDRTTQGECGVYFDDGSTGSVIGNVFYKVGRPGNAQMGAIFIHMGKDVLIENNLFIECEIAVGMMPCGREQWLDFLQDPDRKMKFRQAVDSTQPPGGDFSGYGVDITRPPYTTQYPALLELAEYPDRNFVRHNIAYRCGDFLVVNRCRRTKGFESYQTEMTDNLFTDVDPGFVDAARQDFRLKPDSPIFRHVPGFKAIPFEQIGRRSKTGAKD